MTIVVLLGGALLSIRNHKLQPTAPAGSSQFLPGAEATLSSRTLPYPNVPRISVEEAEARLQQGQAVLVDVRSRAAYDQGHAAGALSFPAQEIDARLDEIPRDKELILY